jgi:hypothetical protein
MPTYKGSCHCGDIRIELERPEPIDRLLECDCSICTKKGIVHTPAENHEIRVTQGADKLALYRFGTGEARHEFCPRCGIHVLGRPRSHPERQTVNARCLEDYWDLRRRLTVVQFDGQNHPKDQAE